MVWKVKTILTLSHFAQELDPKEQGRLLIKYGLDIKESDYEREMQVEVSGHEIEEDKQYSTKFEKQDIFDEVKERQNYDISQLRSYQLKKGTGTWFIKKFSEELVEFILITIQEYKQLFFKDPADKQS